MLFIDNLIFTLDILFVHSCVMLFPSQVNPDKKFLLPVDRRRNSGLGANNTKRQILSPGQCSVVHQLPALVPWKAHWNKSGTQSIVCETDGFELTNSWPIMSKFGLKIVSLLLFCTVTPYSR